MSVRTARKELRKRDAAIRKSKRQARHDENEIERLEALAHRRLRKLKDAKAKLAAAKERQNG